MKYVTKNPNKNLKYKNYPKPTVPLFYAILNTSAVLA